MDIEHDYKINMENNVSLISFSVFGSFFFNVIVLNITIAIFGNTYDRVQDLTPLHFMKGRADYTVKTILACYILPWRGEMVNQIWMCLAGTFLVTGVFLGKQTAAGMHNMN